jgi:hypothetical protein
MERSLKEYTAPEMEVIIFEEMDVVTTSCLTDEQNAEGGEY